MKIAIVRLNVSAHKGGAGCYCLQVAQALVARGHEVHLFARRWSGPTVPGLRYHYVRAVSKPSWLRVLSFHWCLRRRLIRSEFDLVLGMSLFAPQGFYWLGDGLYASGIRLGWPCRWLRWLNCVQRPVLLAHLWLERRVMRAQGHQSLICNSLLVKRQVIEKYQVPPERIHVVRQGVDLQRFRPEVRTLWRRPIRHSVGLPQDAYVLLFAANNFRRNGLHYLLAALGKIVAQHPQVQLLVAGRGRIGRYRLFVKWSGLASHVHFLGPVTQMEPYLGAADLFVLPTRYDAFAAACLEAMACGLPVITTRWNGVAELIESGVHGWVLDRADNVAQLAHYIQELLLSPRTTEMGRLAAQQAARFSGKQPVEGLVSLIEGADLGRKSREAVQVREVTPGLLVNRQFERALNANRFISFDEFMSDARAKVHAYNQSKRLHVFGIRDESQPLTLFQKRYLTAPTWPARVLSVFRAPSLPKGMQEWRNIVMLKEAGHCTVTPVAAGCRTLPNGSHESFVMTLGLDGYLPLDQYLRQRFAWPLDAVRLREKRRLIRAVAEYVGKLHWHGFIHRDLYLCHVYIKVDPAGPTDLRLIDLERVRWQPRIRPRWQIKDLAALNYSSLVTPVTDQDRIRFFVLYERACSVKSPRLRQLSGILAKTDTIARHDIKSWARAVEASGGSSAPQGNSRRELGNSRRATKLRPVSIVTVTYDGLFFVRLLVEKVREFVGSREYEIIVVDRGSRDGTREWVRAQPDVRLYTRPQWKRGRHGHGKSAEIGARKARHDIVALLDSDAHPVDQCWLELTADKLDEQCRLAGAQFDGHHRGNPHGFYIHPHFMVFFKKDLGKHVVLRKVRGHDTDTGEEATIRLLDHGLKVLGYPIELCERFSVGYPHVPTVAAGVFHAWSATRMNKRPWTVARPNDLGVTRATYMEPLVSRLRQVYQLSF